MKTNIKIIAKMPVAPENAPKFKELARELVEKSRQEPGNIFSDGLHVKFQRYFRPSNYPSCS